RTIARERAVVVPRAVADAVPDGVDRERRDDDDVETLGEGCIGRRLHEAVAALLEGARVGHHVEGHLAGLGLDRRVGDLGAARAERGCERPAMRLVAVDHWPEAPHADGARHGLVRLETSDAGGRALLARLDRRGLADAAEARPELGLRLQAEKRLRRELV